MGAWQVLIFCFYALGWTVAASIWSMIFWPNRAAPNEPIEPMASQTFAVDTLVFGTDADTWSVQQPQNTLTIEDPWAEEMMRRAAGVQQARVNAYYQQAVVAQAVNNNLMGYGVAAQEGLNDPGHQHPIGLGLTTWDAETEQRGQQLLRAWLSPEQRECFERNSFFEVTGSGTGKRYRIRYGKTYNVDELDARGNVIQRLCFTPNDCLCQGDVMLAQKIALECDEGSALAVANRAPPPEAYFEWGQQARVLGEFIRHMVVP